MRNPNARARTLAELVAEQERENQL